MLITNEDNMELMARYPDNHFELAIVDPEYGIGAEQGYGQSNNKKIHDRGKKWDNKIPSDKYFDELFRISKNQIIWGGNYFIEHLKNTRCIIIWDKLQQGKNFSDFEMAWTSFDLISKIVKIRYIENYECNIYNTIKRIHPTQKPVKLYEWLLMNYAKEGDKILDTHLGSGSIAIACHNLGFDLTACELDKEYFDAAMKRLEIHKSQQRLF